MAVSNPATLSSVLAEFGAPAGTKLSTFLRGGAWVPNGPAANAGVPTALPISLSQLAGAIKNSFGVSVSPTSVLGSRSTAGTASSSAATVTPNGNTGTVTGTWTVVTTLGNTISAVSPTSLTSGFSATVNGTNDTASGYAYFVAHDSGTSLNAQTGNVNITLSYTGP